MAKRRLNCDYCHHDIMPGLPWRTFIICATCREELEPLADDIIKRARALRFSADRINLGRKEHMALDLHLLQRDRLDAESGHDLEPLNTPVKVAGVPVFFTEDDSLFAAYKQRPYCLTPIHEAETNGEESNH